MCSNQRKTVAGEIDTFIEEMDLCWSHILGKSPFFRKFTEVWVPAIDILETDDNVIVLIELPGMEEKNFKVTIRGDLLTIHGEKKVSNEKVEGSYSNKEIYLGPFERSCVLPAKVEYKKVVSHFDKGILTLTIPKVKKVQV